MSGRRKMADRGTGEQEEPPMSGFIVDASVSAAPSIAQSGYRSCGGWSGNLLLSAPRSRRITAAKCRGLV